MSISDETNGARQLSMPFEPSITERYGSCLEVVAAGIYKRGNLKLTAADLDTTKGNLSVMLSGDGQRHFGLDHFERYMEATGDLMGLDYLDAKYRKKAGAELVTALAMSRETIKNMAATISALTEEIEALGGSTSKRNAKRSGR